MGACRTSLQEGFAPKALTPVRLAAIYGLTPPPPCQHLCYAPASESLKITNFCSCRNYCTS